MHHGNEKASDRVVFTWTLYQREQETRLTYIISPVKIIKLRQNGPKHELSQKMLVRTNWSLDVSFQQFRYCNPRKVIIRGSLMCSLSSGL